VKVQQTVVIIHTFAKFSGTASNFSISQKEKAAYRSLLKGYLLAGELAEDGRNVAGIGHH